MEYGALLGDRGLAALENLTPIAGGKVKTGKRTLDLEIDHTDDGMLNEAQIVTNFWTETNDRKATDAMAKPYGINSPYHARAILRRSGMAARSNMTIHVVGIGDLAFVLAPYEMFSNNGADIRSSSPFPATVVATCSNNGYSYLASKLAFDYGCYEVDNRNFVQGTAEKVAANFLEMLQDLKNTTD